MSKNKKVKEIQHGTFNEGDDAWCGADPGRYGYDPALPVCTVCFKAAMDYLSDYHTRLYAITKVVGEEMAPVLENDGYLL